MKKLSSTVLLSICIITASSSANGMKFFSEVFPSLRRSIATRLYSTGQEPTAHYTKSLLWNKGYVPTKKAQEHKPISFDDKSTPWLYVDPRRYLPYFYKSDVNYSQPAFRTPMKPSQTSNL